MYPRFTCQRATCVGDRTDSSIVKCLRRVRFAIPPLSPRASVRRSRWRGARGATFGSDSASQLGRTGADGTRTHDLLVANQALSQLSYGPTVESSEAEKLSAAILTGASAAFAGHPVNEQNPDQHQGSNSDPLHRRGTMYWARQESNLRLRRYQRRALTN